MNDDLNQINHYQTIFKMENIDILTWTIDRNPDYNLLNNSIYTIDDAVDIIRNNIDIDYYPTDTEETEDFIPFAPYNPTAEINVNVEDFDITEEDINCCVCMDTQQKLEICKLICSHKFCSKCTITHISINRNKPFCPLCRKNITSILVKTDDVFEKFKNL